MFTGPNIVTDGLILALDAANVKSFRGEPTVNYITDTPSQGGWSGTYEVLDSSRKTFRFNINNFNGVAGSGQGWRSFTWNLNAYSGQTVTISAIVEVPDSSPGTFAWMMVGQTNTHTNNGSGAGTYLGYSTAGERVQKTTSTKERITWSGTLGSTGTASQPSGHVGFTVWYNGGTSGVNSYITVSDVQIELKPYATPFVNGTRGTTVATGGGWIDKSGNNNHGELVNGPAYNSANGGSIVFDGTDNRITIPHNSSIGMSDNFTFSILVKSSTWTSDNQEGLVQKGTVSNYGAYLRGGGGTVSFYTSPTSYWAPGPDIGGDGRWHLLTFVYSYSQLGYKQVYVDGLYHSQLAVTVPITSNTSDIQIGFANVGAPQYLNAEVANYILYNRVLTSQEILQNFNATKSRFGL